MTIQFLGAARTVTGSCYLVRNDYNNILVDCGMFQGEDLEQRNYAPFQFNPSEVQALLLTHAHLDHCGLIPRLVKEGFKGKIYATSATRDLYEINAYDSAKIQKEDMWMHNGKLLYTASDVLKSLSLFHVVDYSEEEKINSDLSVEFYDAGHILGSSFITINMGGIKVTFSGDLGHEGQLIVRNLNNLSQTDYLIMESTYGDRQHKSREDTEKELIQIINETNAKGGNILIPSFAVERTQELIFLLKLLIQEGKIPKIPIYIDSPLAIKATKIFAEHYDNFNIEALNTIREKGYPFTFDELHYVESYTKSKRLSRRNIQKVSKANSGFILLAGSGMCNGGRILKYLQNNLALSRSTVIFIGFQAIGTLGRDLVNGAKRVTVSGKNCAVRARIATVGGFSAHADQLDLINWIGNSAIKPKTIFLVHGEEESSLQLSQLITTKYEIPTIVPNWRDVVNIK